MKNEKKLLEEKLKRKMDFNSESMNQEMFEDSQLIRDYEKAISTLNFELQKSKKEHKAEIKKLKEEHDSIVKKLQEQIEDLQDLRKNDKE